MRASIVALLVVTACSSAPPKDPPDFADDPAPSARRTRGEESVLEGAPMDPAPSASGSGSAARSPSSAPPVTYRGTASATNAFVFGGDPYDCYWRIRFESIHLDVRADASGKVESATLEADAVEETLAPCQATPYPRNAHVYSMTKATPLAAGVTRIELAPKSTNEPAASATIDVDLSTPSATAAIDVHRTDQPPPLDWTVKAKLSLESK